MESYQSQQALTAAAGTTTMVDASAVAAAVPGEPGAGAPDPARPNPNPIDLQIFLPWACRQLQATDEVLITKVLQAEYVGVQPDKRRRSKIDKGFSVAEALQSEMAAMKSSESYRPVEGDKIKITVVHNLQDKCVHLKLLNNRSIPRLLLKILGLVVHFHTHLSALTINAGADTYTLHELALLLPRSNITDLCLDGAGRPGLDYTLLLAQPSQLRHLSLARCKVDDKMVAQIAELITPPEPASTALKLLNLASNRITDVGAYHLADALRTNRTLNYLNLSDNRISDDGGEAILNVLGEFELTPEEITAYQYRLVQYLHKKFELLNTLKTRLRAADANLARRPKSSRYETSIEQRAVQLLDGYLGSFADPFAGAQTVRRGRRVFCKGNTALAYLSVAHCDLHYVWLRRAVRVVEQQRRRASGGAFGGGLVALALEGNPLPRACFLYDHLQLLLAGPPPRRMSVRRARPRSDEPRL